MIFLIILILVFNIQNVFAQEVFKFFEFAPRSQDNIILGDKILIQPFIPFNDYLSIIGFWLENPTSTRINLKILLQNNLIIFEKNFTIPYIEKSWWGEEYLLPLGENLRINSGEEYKISITPTENSQLKFFTKNILELLQGSETYLYFPESLKTFTINNEKTNFTLKLSLYEGRENSPPVISNLQTIINNPRSVTISFNVNEPIIYNLEYRADSDLATSTYQIDYFQSCPPSTRNCLINLDVLPGKSYHFILKAIDFWNNFSLAEGNFQTPSETEYQQSQQENLQSTSGQITTFTTSSQPSQFLKSKENYQDQQRLEDKTKKSITQTITSEKNKDNYLINQNAEPLKSSSPIKEKETKKISTLSSTTSFSETSTAEKINFLEKINLIKQIQNIFKKSKLKFVFLIAFIVFFASIFFLTLKNKKKIFSFFQKNKAFTLFEISLVILLIGFIVLSLFLLVLNISNINANFVFNLKGTGDALLFFKEIERELRTMQNSNIGNYPIEIASSTKIVFYSDIDDDGLIERISYFIEGTELKKSIITPSGNPLSYNSSTEKILMVVKNLIVPQVIFSYYDTNNQTTTDVSKIKTIKTNLKIYQSFGKNMFENYIIVNPRNLRFQE